MKNELFSLKGKVAVITGGHQGIGKAAACGIADAGADVCIIDLQDSADVAAAIAGEFGVRAKSYICNVTDPDAVEACIRRAASDMGTLDLLFNNAGITHVAHAEEMSAEDWDRVVKVNYYGIFYVATAFARYLIENKKGGSIVNTASMSSHIVNIPQCQAGYNSSKAGVRHLTKTLAVEWWRYGIRVNSISPGYIRTELTSIARKDWVDFWMNQMPGMRFGVPEELVGGVIYLLSDAASYTSGSDLVMDGCFTCV